MLYFIFISQAWLTKTQTDVASEDTPASLAEAEKLLSQHQSIREEIDNYTDDYTKMMEYGEKITAEPSTQDDPQYMFLRERLKALKDGWAELHQMWENRLQLLSQSLSLQVFTFCLFNMVYKQKIIYLFVHLFVHMVCES